MATKMIRTLALISLVSGKTLCSFGNIHEAAEWVMGHPIWSHEFASKELWQRMRDAVLSQYPTLDVDVSHITSDNFPETLPPIAAMFPDELSVEQGTQLRTEDLLESLNRLTAKAN